ncbi:hypothetical protein AMD27_17655 (plasmid) [Acinetobacter sp. TGL-Y2]|uniref:head GIN domain-containing protein n=1 Tax=Acinetobacter sp. TGL-Y2 TaxID=1407071 RepID=UPI0007A667F5|nr:head GIN domain-containing protein [Acinetobacter sp. TGL-Y2]AMW80742.1 hypothetical protein AMD27_17655 [Acinetobacter sp. TGL-Y2]
MSGKTFFSQTKHTIIGNVQINNFNGTFKNGGFHSSGIVQIIGSGIQKTVTLNPQPFSRLKVKGCFDINFMLSNSESIQIIADDNLVDLVDLEYAAETLIVGFKENVSFQTQNPLLINIAYPRLDAVELKGSGNINVANLNQDTFEALLKGSGDIDLKGTVGHAILTLSGSGDIDAIALKALRVDAKLKGSGDIEATATDAADVRLSGSGDIKIYGNPASQQSKCSGSGDIKFK